MKKFMTYYLKTFFGRELELRVKLFHVLAITGVIICIAMTGVSIAGGMLISAGINFGAGLISLALLIYSSKSGNYQFCYGISIAVIFFALFPSLFFSGGGYKGGMSFFFVFAVVFTVYMLDGWNMLIVSVTELVFYSVLCVQAYRHPEWVVAFPTETAVVTDIIVGLVTVSISLGATMFVQLRMYQRQQVELERSRKEAETASKAKSTFLANMSHEIRTPIHMILGMNEIIHRESRSRQVLEYSEKIDETSKMLLSLVDSVLDVSKIESGKMELMPEPYESDELVRTLALIGRTHCGKKKLAFDCCADENLPTLLYGDIAHIRQIAANFLSNAAKYTESGTVTLKVTQEPGEKEDQILLCISVTDTGSGISKEALPTLFDSFIRADLGSHRYIEGTGLGLTIVKELTALMGGTVAVESEKGKGSTFTAKLPQTVLPEEQLCRADQNITFKAPEVRLLVVDDNEGNRILMKKLLLPTQVQVDTAESGEECLSLVQENSYHVILMDYMMPGQNGLETVEKLRLLPDFSTPVIALTADATAETETKLLEGGFSAYLTKPIPWAKLQETLLSYLPEDLVTVTTREKEALPEYPELEKTLEPYGISATNALQYFGNDLQEYVMMAQLFLRYDEEEQGKVQKLCQKGNCSQLVFSVHALKGKAKNLGMGRLSEISAYMEQLCKEKKVQELQSICPYLLFLWKQGHEGLELLVKDNKPAEQKKSSRDSLGDCLERLPRLLWELRRKPSLDCIDQLMKEESDEEGRALLAEIRKQVDAIAFEEAGAAFQSYLQWKRGGKES